MNEETKRLSKHITHKQFYALVQWMATNAERLMKERPTYTVAAKEAATAIGAESISIDHTFKQAMEVSGVHWQSAIGTKLSYPRISKEEYAQLKARLTQVEADLVIMRGLVHHLYRELKEPPPHGYTLPTVSANDIRIIPKEHHNAK